MRPAQASGPLLSRLFPAQIDNRFEGSRAALWLLGLFIALKLVMSLNSILNTEAVAVGADGIPLDDFSPAAARQVLTLFALTALGQLALTVVALAVLVRYRAMVPFFYLMFLGEALARRFIVQSHQVTRVESVGVGAYINYGILALLAVGLVLSLLPKRTERLSSSLEQDV